MPSLLRRLTIIVIVVLGVSVPGAPGGLYAADSLQGWFLVASPQMADPRFGRTVIFMVRHDSSGAMGLIVNKVLPEPAGRQVLARLGIAAPGAETSMRVHFGGPVEPYQGFVLHSPDFDGGHTLRVTPYASLTTSAEILSAIGAGNGPKKSLFLLGYAGWGPGQLENELRLDAWSTVPADAATLFDDDRADLWEKTLARRGVDL